MRDDVDPDQPDAAEADAALMDGHPVTDGRRCERLRAAEADAALMDGH